MRKIFITIILTILSFTIWSQNYISGKVTDVQNEPIIGANIILKGTVRAAETNKEGQYILKNIKPGNYTLQISMVGFKNFEKPLEVKSDSKINIDQSLAEAIYELNGVHIVASKGVQGTEHMAEVEGLTINAGKKNEIIKISNIDANLAMNNSRQVFGRLPGISIWENDGSGIQTSVASRGLNPNRSWEFNTRLNGYDVTPDPMGYPEAYYTPPMEVVDRIEIVRGASALQYGSQFGGLMNFVLRKPDISTKVTVESQNTVGSNGLFSTFNYIGGTEGKLSYTAFYQKRIGNGWRDNSYFNTDHAHVQLSYAASSRLKLGLEMTYMDYISQQPGGLTDAQFAQNARQSSRSRNWFSAPWLVPALTADYVFNENNKLNFKVFGTLGERNSVGFTQAITVADNGGNRQVDRDIYKNIGAEIKYLKNYNYRGRKNSMLVGARWFDGYTNRLQVGRGNAGTDYNISLEPGSAYVRDLSFDNINYALFTENVFRLTNRFLITGGIRYEHIASYASGRIAANSTMQPLERYRNFVIAGIGAEYHPNATTEFYTNLSQAYRPILFGDLTPPATTDVIDQNLKDASGVNFDLGYRGKVGKFLNFDLGYFHINYNDRIGTITQEDANKVKYQLRTNLGQSINKGFEGYAEFDPLNAFIKNNKWGSLSVFASIAYIDARYQDLQTTTVKDGAIVMGNLKGNRVENAPQKINRYGITYRKKNASLTWQLNDIGLAYADAANTVTPNAASTTGLIPAYTVQDISGGIKFAKIFNIRAGVNNLTDKRYFTRRAGGYPGPGILPGEGRTVFASLGIKI